MAERGGVTALYLPGIAGSPAPSPALEGLDVVAVEIPGLDGRTGFEAPPDYLGWLTEVWDAIDATGRLPCPVIGASVGGMLAAELAALRPEAVTRLALLAPFGLWDPEVPGEDLYAAPVGARLSLLFAGEVPDAFGSAFSDLGEIEQSVRQYMVQVAGASLVWPIPDHGLASRIHRITCPTLVVWGEEDRLLPVSLAERWPASERLTVPGAGHLVEWDAPDSVRAALDKFLS